MSGTFEDFLAEEQNRTGGNYSDPINISLDDFNAADTDNFDFGYDPYDTSYLDDLFSNTVAGYQAPKDDKNFLEKMFGGVGSALGGVGSALGLGGGGSKNNTLATLLALGGASFAKDRGYLDKDIPVVGYQGKIPKYQYVQEQVTGRDDSDRRPGSAGRRYMSDGIYAKAPENQQPMSVAEAKAKAKAQAQGFAEGGDVAAFLQGIGGEGGGQSFQQLMQGMQPQGRAAPQRMQTAPEPAPMPMPAPSGGMGGLDISTLAALLQAKQGQQGGEAQPQQAQESLSRFGSPVGGRGVDVPPNSSPTGRAYGSLTKLKEAAQGKMPTPATDTIGTSGYKLGEGDRPQKSSSPIGAGSPVKMPGERAPDRLPPRAIEDMIKKIGDFPPMQSKPTPMPKLPPRQPAPPMDYSKILESLGGIGGIGMAEGGYLNGDSDGQADKVPGSIDGVQEAKLSHGEYVLPADLVSLLGNGNSDAGAKALDDFMAMVRKQGTGTEKQQKNIDAAKVLETLTKKPKRAPRANKALARKMGKG